MGIHFEHFPAQNFMLIILHGRISDTGMRTHINRLLGDEYATPGARGLIVICGNASAKELGTRTVFGAGMSMHAAKFRQGGKLAIVAEGSLAYGLARVYHTATQAKEVDETRIFRGGEMADAVQWLDIDALTQQIHERVGQCKDGQAETARQESTTSRP